MKKTFLTLLAITALSILITLIFFPTARSIESIKLPSINAGYIEIPSPQKASWVNFWSLTCSPCIKELPVLNELHHSHQHLLTFHAIAAPQDPPHLIKSLQDDLSLTLPISFDMHGKAQAIYDAEMAIPRHFLVNQDGKIVFEHTGQLDKATILRAIEQHL